MSTIFLNTRTNLALKDILIHLGYYLSMDFFERNTHESPAERKGQAISDEARQAGHLFLDDALGGASPLEGSSARNTTAQLLNFINKVQTKAPRLPKHITNLLQQGESKEQNIATPLDALQKEIQPLGNFYSSLHAKNAEISAGVLPEMKANIIAKEIIQEYQKTGNALFPGGYSGTPGHAMIYQIKQEGAYARFLVYNTGADIETYHSSKLNGKLTKRIYRNVVGYKIPLKNIETLPEAFQGFISSLLIPQIDRSKSYEPETLYQTIFPRAAFLDGVPLTETEIEKVRRRFRSSRGWHHPSSNLHH